MDTDLFMWEGFSGRSYEFWTYKLNKTFGPIEAVFIYAKWVSDDQVDLLYVNQTDRMDMVCANPISDYIIDKYHPSSLHIWKCPVMEDRKAVMMDLLMKYNPPGNRGSD